MIIEILQNDKSCVFGGACYCWDRRNMLVASSFSIVTADECQTWCCVEITRFWWLGSPGDMGSQTNKYRCGVIDAGVTLLAALHIVS